ncbi:MAG: phage capsid protein [Phenylobacterium sp.]|uniref:hypothetical protein n=1 Tax=Phenylobacterium sp. TaxID=1871053 RepID=UPI0017D94A13|nr:hypothetical protein [Phenylobacterium sp.]MBA4792292.1 phage capsid protein [Phenylobacterium sp.]
MARPFPVNPTLTGIALAYTNEEMIADQVLPYASPVKTEEFTYLRYAEGEGQTVPDTRIGRRSEANTIEVSATEETSKVVPHALSDLIPMSDLDNAPQGYDPKAHATETVTELMVLRREVDVAGLVHAPASYAAGHKTQLAGADQWSDPDSDPFQAMWDALDIPLMRPNMGVMGRSVWNKIATHPKLITKLYGAASTVGKARLQDLADMLEIKKILIGSARVNTAKKGQPVNLQRAWGNHAAFLYINPLANNERGMTFGMTVPMGQRFATREIPEPKIGIEGSLRVQVEDRRKELITAPNCGYLFQDAIAAA